MKYLIPILLLISVAQAEVDYVIKFGHPQGDLVPVGQCGQIRLTYQNKSTNGETLSFDYRLDEQPGSDDDLTGKKITSGINTGQPYGQRYSIVNVEAGKSEHVDFDLEGDHKVSTRYWRGPNPDKFLPWDEVETEYDDTCINCDKPSLDTPDDIARAVKVCRISPDNIEIVDFKINAKVTYNLAK